GEAENFHAARHTGRTLDCRASGQADAAADSTLSGDADAGPARDPPDVRVDPAGRAGERQPSRRFGDQEHGDHSPPRMCLDGKLSHFVKDAALAIETQDECTWPIAEPRPGRRHGSHRINAKREGSLDAPPARI